MFDTYLVIIINIGSNVVCPSGIQVYSNLGTQIIFRSIVHNMRQSCTYII